MDAQQTPTYLTSWSASTETSSDRAIAPGESRVRVATGAVPIARGIAVPTVAIHKELAGPDNEENGARTSEVSAYCLIDGGVVELFTFALRSELC